jgi:hypothetical protein
VQAGQDRIQLPPPDVAGDKVVVAVGLLLPQHPPLGYRVVPTVEQQGLSASEMKINYKFKIIFYQFRSTRI